MSRFVKSIDSQYIKIWQIKTHLLFTQNFMLIVQNSVSQPVDLEILFSFSSLLKYVVY